MSTLQKVVGVAGQSSCQVSDAVSHSSTMPVSSLSQQDSTVCDSGSESMGFSDTDHEVGSSIKETLLSIKALNGEAEKISQSKEKSNGNEGTNGIIRVEDTADPTESKAVVLPEDEDQDEDTLKEDEDRMKNKMEEERLLSEEKDDFSGETPVNEDEEYRLLLGIEEAEKDKLKIISRRNVFATVADPDEGAALPDRVNSPVSENESSQFSSKLEQDGNSKLSDSESLSSNTSENKKHPLFIGNNVKYSFKGIMKTAVERVSQDSDSVRSLSPRRDDSKPCSPKPDSSVTSTGSNSQPEETDLPADSSTMPDNRNLFEKLSHLTDTSKVDIEINEDQGSNSEISTSKENVGTTADSASAEDGSEGNSTPVCNLDEPMETDSPDIIAEDSNSGLSAVSTTSADLKEDSSGGKECIELDTGEKAMHSKRDPSDELITKAASSTSRSQSPVCNFSASDKAKLEEPAAKCPTVTCKSDIKVDDKSESKICDDNNIAEDQAMVKDPKDNSTDPNLLDKDIKPKVEENVEPLTDVKVENSEVNLEESQAGDRKRSAVEESDDSKPKRSRLDFVIGKLGSQIGISPDNIKCDETMFDSDVDESGKTSSDTTENRSEEVTSEDDETALGSSCKRLSGESLEELIKLKIKDVLEQQREVLTKQFQEKINELQASNEAWKTKAKELHRRALELMNHQQRQDRRRAARESGQRRNVGIQVGEDRINSANQQTTSRGASSPGRVLPMTSATSSNPVTLLTSKPSTVTTTAPIKPPASQLLLQRMTIPNAVRPVQNNWKDQSSAVKSILNNNRIGQLSGATQTLASVSQSSQAGKPAATKPASSQLPISSSNQTPVQTLVKVIDLTSDEESSSAKGMAIARTVAGQSLLNQSLYRPATTTTLPSGARLVFSSPAGTQFVSNQTALTSAQPRQAGVQYQFLYAPANQAVGSGNVVTVVSPSAGGASTAVRAATPAPPQLTRPTQPAVSRPVQNTPAQRAPPPLQSAPTKVSPSTAVAGKEKTENKSVSTDKSVTKPSEILQHPAPLPPQPANQDMSANKKALPPKPSLKISRVSQGIVLSWNMITSSSHADIASYQLFAYQETSAPVSSSFWKKVGDVKALPLPMACTLTQFQEGNKYHFAVRAVDVHGRMSMFSDPSTIHLVVQNTK